jgi:hypothetical protein
MMPSDNKEERQTGNQNMLADAMQELARSMSGGRISNGE